MKVYGGEIQCRVRISDGGAHSKFFTVGRFPTETLIKFGRDNRVMTLERAHWRLSAHPAMCDGFKDRGMLVEVVAADLLLCDLDKLNIKPPDIVYDSPGGEWHRVERVAGYKIIMANGEVTLEEERCTGATSNRLPATAAAKATDLGFEIQAPA